MWLKHQGTYYNLDRHGSLSFRKNSIAFNVKASTYMQVQTRFMLSDSELEFIEELFRSAIELRREIFDIDELYEKLRKRKR